MADIKLESLTKADLIWVINQMRLEPLGDHRFRRAMIELEHQREMDRIDEVDRQLEISIEANKQAADILRPYDGQRIVDIPHAVLEQADKCRIRGDVAFKKYLKLTEVSS